MNNHFHVAAVFQQANVVDKLLIDTDLLVGLLVHEMKAHVILVKELVRPPFNAVFIDFVAG